MVETSAAKVASLVERTRFSLKISLPIGAALAPAAAPAPEPALIKLDLTMRNQCHSHWCWAAVAEAIAMYYNPATDCTQCVIANGRLSRDDCCGPECSSDDDLPFNIDSTLGSTLHMFGCDDGEDFPDQPAPLEKIQAKIDDQRPVCIRVVWTTGGTAGRGHFVAIIGYLSGTDELLVADPFGPQLHHVSYKVLANAFTLAKGKWANTYYTKFSKKTCQW
jgi:Papain-like cysteine protease AvrRpt2